MMPTDKANEAYDKGYQIGLDALEACAALDCDQADSLRVTAGLLTVALHATYFMSPDAEAAALLIAACQSTAVKLQSGAFGKGATKH